MAEQTSATVKAVRTTDRISMTRQRLAVESELFKPCRPSARTRTGQAAPATMPCTSLAAWPPVPAWDTSWNVGHLDQAVSSRLARAVPDVPTEPPLSFAEHSLPLSLKVGPVLPPPPRCTCSVCAPAPPPPGQRRPTPAVGGQPPQGSLIFWCRALR